MKKQLAGLLFMLSVAVGAKAQTTDTFTPWPGADCAPDLGPIEPQCYFIIEGTNSEGQPRWLTYNTNAGTLNILMAEGNGLTADQGFSGLSVTVTPILSYSIPAGPAYWQYATKVSYQEMKGAFTGGTIDLLFETYGQFKPFGRNGVKVWQYKILVVASVVDQNGATVAGYGPSIVSY